MNTQLNQLTETAYKAARQSLDVAATSADHASDLLREVSKSLRDLGERLEQRAAAAVAETPAAKAPAARAKSKARPRKRSASA